MAPSNENEPLVLTEENEDKSEIEYAGTVTFKKNNLECATVVYVTKSDSKENAEEYFRKMVDKDFPCKDFHYFLSVAEKTSPTQQATKRTAITKLQSEYARNRVFIVDPTVPVEETKIEEPVVEEEISTPIEPVIEQPKEEIKEEVQELPKRERKKKVKQVKVVPKIETQTWFGEFNINIGGEKFRKGLKIEKVTNETEARKALDLLIKKKFTRVRSVTKVTLELWDNQKEEFSEAIDTTPVAPAQPVEKVETIKKTLEDLINENFSEEDLNKKMLQIVISAKKIRPRDFDDGFIICEDEGQTDTELFEQHKKECPGLRKKNFAVKRVRFRQILTTSQYKRMINSSQFIEAVEQKHDGYAGLNAAMKKEVERRMSELDGLKAELKSLETQNVNEMFDNIMKARRNIG